MAEARQVSGREEGGLLQDTQALCPGGPQADLPHHPPPSWLSLAWALLGQVLGALKTKRAAGGPGGWQGPSDKEQSAGCVLKQVGAEACRKWGRSCVGAREHCSPGSCVGKGPGVGLGSVGWRPVCLEWHERVGDRKLRGEQGL